MAQYTYAYGLIKMRYIYIFGIRLLEKPNAFKPFPFTWHLQIICFWQSNEIKSYVTFSCKNSKMQIMWLAPSCIKQAT